LLRYNQGSTNGVYMNGFTPGPWWVSHEESPLDHCMELTVKSADGSQVCSFIGDEQNFADARLIAAAPELLASVLELTRPWDGVEMNPGTVTRGRAAIANATLAQPVQPVQPQRHPLTDEQIHERYKAMRTNETRYVDIYRDAEAAHGIRDKT
jgi:hypothetical protein